jgi:ribonuclease D
LNAGNRDYTLIEKQSELITYLDTLDEQKNRTVALDLEAELNLHAYGQKLCLIQIYDGTNKILIDPLEIDNHTLKSFFENRNILKIVYDAGSDSSFMKNAYDIELKSMLDLRPAVDLLKYEKQDLHSVIAAELGVILNHKSKYHRYNWTRRPLDKEAIDYALNDVIYLFKLKDALLGKIYAANLLDMFILKNLQVQNKDYALDPSARYRRMKGFHALAPDEKSLFKKIFNVREKYAEIANIPSDNVIRRQDLLDIAKGLKQIDEIRFPNRLSNDFIKRIISELKNITK